MSSLPAVEIVRSHLDEALTTLTALVEVPGISAKSFPAGDWEKAMVSAVFLFHGLADFHLERGVA